MAWELLYTEEYENWFKTLTKAEQEDVLSVVDLLITEGPHLPRPYADTLKGASKVKNLKELRIQHSGNPYRVFYAFDPERRAILLCGGRKGGARDKRFYDRMIPMAERVFLDHLSKNNLNLREEVIVVKPYEELKKQISPEVLAGARVKTVEILTEMTIDEVKNANADVQPSEQDALCGNQSRFSQLEKRPDALISILSQRIEALGGKLEIQAKFSDGQVVEITQFK